MLSLTYLQQKSYSHTNIMSVSASIKNNRSYDASLFDPPLKSGTCVWNEHVYCWFRPKKPLTFKLFKLALCLSV